MIKRIVRFCILALLSFFSAYLIFLAITSSYIGLAHAERPGFWMPIFFGLLVLCLAVLLIRLIVHIGRKAKNRDNYPTL